jgi:hypothetical protein
MFMESDSEKNMHSNHPIKNRWGPQHCSLLRIMSLCLALVESGRPEGRPRQLGLLLVS